jgi:hypothetical protein
MPKDLVLPELPLRAPVAAGGAAGATFHRLGELLPTGVELKEIDEPLAPSKRISLFTAERGAKLTLYLPRAESGPCRLRLVALHRPDAGALRVHVNGTALQLEDDRSGEVASLRTEHGTRLQNVSYREFVARQGANEIVLEAVEPGAIGVDYLWLRATAPKR